MQITSWKDRATRLATSAKRAREQAAAIGERAVGAGAAVAAGYGTGVLVKKFGDKAIPNTEIPIIPAAAAVVALLGVAGAAGKMSDVATHAGAGALAGYAAIKASK